MQVWILKYITYGDSENLGVFNSWEKANAEIPLYEKKSKEYRDGGLTIEGPFWVEMES